MHRYTVIVKSNYYVRNNVAIFRMNEISFPSPDNQWTGNAVSTAPPSSYMQTASYPTEYIGLNSTPFKLEAGIQLANTQVKTFSEISKLLKYPSQLSWPSFPDSLICVGFHCFSIINWSWNICRITRTLINQKIGAMNITNFTIFRLWEQIARDWEDIES